MSRLPSRSCAFFASLLAVFRQRIGSCIVLALTVLGWQAVQVSASDQPVRFLTAVDMSGTPHRLAADPDIKATALVFISTECPISRQYVPELNRLSEQFTARGGTLLGVLYDPTLSRAEAATFCSEFQLAFPVLFDGSGELARHFKPTHVPEAFVLDGAGSIVYRGRIDDLYSSVDKRRAQPIQRDLHDAMLAALTGQAVAHSQTSPVGCRLGPIANELPSRVTYTRDIAPILFANCAECHRTGEVAPFALLSYQDAQKRADWLCDVTSTGLMPPWKAEVGHVEFLGERRLSSYAVKLLQAWAEAGAPEGEASDLPPLPEFPSGWRLGEPDLVLRAPVPFTVPADGPDIFQHFVIPMELLEDKNLVAFEFKPGNPAVVHHAVLFLDTMGFGRAKDAETPEPGYVTFGSIGVPTAGIVGVWTPGMTPRFLPEGMGQIIPAGADLIVQLHIHPSGKEESDQSSVGLYFSDTPPERLVSRMPLVLGTLIVDIPADEPLHVVTSSVTVPTDVTLISVLPHMHLLGKEMKVTAHLPDGQELPIIWIKDWNFYWQDNYVYREPLTLPAGTRLDIFSSYDNSADNPFNPSTPPRRVLFGNGSADEMSFAIFQMTADGPGGQQSMQMSLRQTFMKQWAESKLDAEARNHIMQELMKLFGAGGDTARFMQLLGGRP